MYIYKDIISNVNMDGNKRNKKLQNIVNKKKYKCIICDYRTDRKWCLKKHNSTRKHLLNCRKQLMNCDFCDKKFKSKSGKWKHLNKCLNNPKNIKIELEKAKNKIFCLEKKNEKLIDDHKDEKIRYLEKHIQDFRNLTLW